MTLWAFIRREANFFRIHLSAFVFVPLISSGIFYASNGRFHIEFIDALFLCYSAMTDTGLATVNLSTLTAWQQVILYLLMLLVSIITSTKINSVRWKIQGDTTFVSWLMVMIRKYVPSLSFPLPNANIDFRRYFRSHCVYVASGGPRRRRSRASLLASISPPTKPFQNQEVVPPRKVTPIPEVEITRGSTDEISNEKHFPELAYNTTHNPEDRIVTNAATVSESPAPLSIPLPSSHHSFSDEASLSSPNFLQQRRVLTFRGN